MNTTDRRRVGLFSTSPGTSSPPGQQTGRGAATPSRLVWALQYVALRLGWTPRRCVVCRNLHWIRSDRPVCRVCRANPDAARDAVTLNLFRHLNQRRRR